MKKISFFRSAVLVLSWDQLGPAADINEFINTNMATMWQNMICLSLSLSLSASRERRSLSRRNSDSIFNPSPSHRLSHIRDILRRLRDDQQDGGKALKLSVAAAVAAGFAVFCWAFVEMAQKSQQRLMNQTNRVPKTTLFVFRTCRVDWVVKSERALTGNQSVHRVSSTLQPWILRCRQIMWHFYHLQSGSADGNLGRNITKLLIIF